MHHRTLVLAAALLLAACSAPPSAVEARRVSSDGTGEAHAVPDRATVTLAIEARAKQQADAQSEADATIGRLLAITDALGIARSAVRTTGIRVQPEFEYGRDGRHQTGFLVQRQLVVELDDLAELGSLMERALASGVNSVEPPVLGSSKDGELRRAALRAAAEDARRNAETLADALGAKLGRVVGVSGSAQGAMPPPGPRMMLAKADAGSVAESYEAGEVRYTATVQAQFELD